MSLAVVDKCKNKRLVKVCGNQVPNKSAKIAEYISIITFYRNQFKELLFESCADCEKMAALPQAAFAASKVRCNQKHDNDGMISAIEGKEKASKEYTYNGRLYLKGWELTPLKYNSKLMNSIWGLYNRYSVHNFKKNTDADEESLATVWKKVYTNPSSVMSASVVVSTSTTMKNPLP